MSIQFLNKGGVNTSDATATADDIISPKIVYGKDGRITGNIIPEFKILNTHIEKESIKVSDNDYGICVALPDNVSYLFVNRNIIVIHKQTEDIKIGIAGFVKNYYPYDVQISELEHSKNHYYFAIKLYQYATQNGSNLANILIFDIDMSTYNITYVKTIEQLSMNYNQGCLCFAKKSPGMLAFVQRSGRYNILSIYDIENDNYTIKNYDFGYNELDPNFIKFECDDNILVIYIQGYNYVRIVNLNNYTVTGNKMFSNCTRLAYTNSIDNKCFFSYTSSSSNKKRVNYGTFDKASGTSVTESYIDLLYDIYDIEILDYISGIYYIGVYCNGMLYIVSFDGNKFVIIDNVQAFGKLAENAITNYNYNLTLHKIYSTSNNAVNILKIEKNMSEKISSLKRLETIYRDTSESTATADDVIKDKVFYGVNGKVTGALEVGLLKNEYENCLNLTNLIIGNTDNRLYIPKECIYSSGTQYLDTGVIPTADIAFEIEYEHTGTVIDYERLLGIRDYFEILRDNKSDDFAVKLNKTSSLSGSIYSLSGACAGRHIIRIGKGKIICDSKELVNYTDEPSTNKTVQILHSVDGDRYGNWKIYSLKIYKNNNILHNFVPCTDLESIAAMYDTETGKFLYNQGNGTLLAE